MNKLFLIIIIVVLFSCKRTKSVEDLIVGDRGFNYWLRIDDNLNDSLLYIDYFDKNGKWIVFLIENGNFIKHTTPDDVVRDERWYLKNDSTMVVGGSSVSNILKLNQDSMIKYNYLWDRKFMYVVLSDSLIPKEYQQIQ